MKIQVITESESSKILKGGLRELILNNIVKRKTSAYFQFSQVFRYKDNYGGSYPRNSSILVTNNDTARRISYEAFRASGMTNGTRLSISFVEKRFSDYNEEYAARFIKSLALELNRFGIKYLYFVARDRGDCCAIEKLINEALE